MRLRFRMVLAVVLAAGAAVYLMNTNLFVSRAAGNPVLLAHRGFAQAFETADLRSDTCTASRMVRSDHDYLENTIDSMRAAFAAGADIVEFDVHPTTEGRFAVFHDWTLDCRTDGQGVTREQSLAYLKTLDIGHGYTADGGKTFPFRGKGKGLMPSLDEVLSTFPDRRFLIHVKSRDVGEGAKLAAVLGRLPSRANLIVYGAEEPVAEVRRALPDIKTMSRSSLVSCLVRYIGYGWTGMVPQACRDTLVLVPINVAPWLWGWPDRFLARFGAAGSHVFVLGPYSGGEFSTGIDTQADIARLPSGYAGGVWTNDIGLVAGALKAR